MPSFRGPSMFITLAANYESERADFTGDGFPDLFLYTEDDNIVSILPNTGNGLFDASHVFTVSQRLTDAVLLDFNRDGKIDVVGCSGGLYVVVLLGNGDGTLTSGQSIEFPARGWQRRISIATAGLT